SQKERLQKLGHKLQALAIRLGLTRSPALQASRSPMLKGVATFALATKEAAEARLQSDAGLRAQWKALSSRIRLIYADPQAAFRAMEFAGRLVCKAEARAKLQQLAQRLQLFGHL